MGDSLDERITEIERILGIDEHSTYLIYWNIFVLCSNTVYICCIFNEIKVRATDFDVASLLEKMRALGLERVMKIPLYKFKKLKSVSTMPETRSLSERLLTIEFCESLIRQRAELLKEFEERLQVVLKTDKVSIAAEQEEQLDILQSDILKSLDDWKQ
ncbi:hypothetical protein DICVIV_02442 [Dictyocaulus viviparus]|uniref:Uncharacterized protein n=1 Tax=Dictyocaulus viviparus TaxID=29172 RepID=A0A0D8Y3I6_DICVI|nr:hypothetical protein DICVIV_02442 [Dictyocaulus viviparus]